MAHLTLSGRRDDDDYEDYDEDDDEDRHHRYRRARNVGLIVLDLGL